MTHLIHFFSNSLHSRYTLETLNTSARNMQLCSKEDTLNLSWNDFYKRCYFEEFKDNNLHHSMCVLVRSLYIQYMFVCVCVHRSSYIVAGCQLVCLVLKSAHSKLGVDFIRLILSSGAKAANLWNCWNPTARSRYRTSEYWLFGPFTPLDKPLFCFLFSPFKCFFFLTLCL